MGNEVGPLTKRFLAVCGYDEKTISSWNGQTRLLHDRGLAGDDAWDEFQIMYEEFKVDFTDFFIGDYFPSEVSWRCLIVSLFPRTKMAGRIRAEYPEITFNMIEEALCTKKWNYKSP